MNDAAIEQKDLRAYLRPVLKRWWLILAVVPVVTVGTYLYYDHKPKIYQASTEIYLQPSTLSQLVFGTKGETQTRIENFALLIPTSAVANRAAENIAAGGHAAGKSKGEAKEKAKDGGKGKGQAKAKPAAKHPVPVGSVEAQAIEKSSFIVITATAGTPGGAAVLANAYAAAFAELQRHQIQREARRTVRTAERQLDDLGHSEATLRRRESLEQQIEQLQLIASQPGSTGGIKQVEPAVANPTPLDHNPTSNAIFALVVSLMLTVGAAYGLEYLNRKITSVEDAEDVYELPVLAEIPKVGSPAPFGPEGVATAGALDGAFQRLQTNLELQADERPLRTIVVVSGAPGEGKSIVARNLALAYREAGRNVAVLDADFRKASLSELLDAHEGPGLSDVLAGRASFGQVVQEVAVPAPNGNGASPAQHAVALAGAGGEMAVVPAGSLGGRFSAALASESMRETLQTAADAYGTAIIDTPPLLAVADALPLLSQADAVIVVTRVGVSTRDSARRLLGTLAGVPNLRVAGLVVNGVPQRTYRARSYGYYDG